MENEKVYLTKEKLEEIKTDLEDLQKELTTLGKHKGELKLGLSSEGTFADVDYEFTRAEYERVSRKISDIRVILANAIIIKAGNDTTKVNIGDIVTARITYSEDDVEDTTFKLVAALNPNLNAEVMEITIKSPVGKAVNGKMIGEKTNIAGIGAFAEILDINYSKSNTPKTK